MSARPSDADAAGGPADAFDRWRIDQLLLDLGAESVRQILDRFRDETAARFVRLRGYSPEREPDDVRREIHSLKSSALGVGMSKLARLAREWENAEQIGEAYAERLAALEAAFRADLAHLQAIGRGPLPGEVTIPA